LEVVGIGFHSCNSITPIIIGKHLAIEVTLSFLYCNILTIIVQSIEKPIGALELPSKKDDEIMFKKVTMLESEEYFIYITIIESNIYSYQMFQGK
jgi:hypothetical protein